jgi:ABC-type nitrate/sulfonate/bicarbonate transport system permease component
MPVTGCGLSLQGGAACCAGFAIAGLVSGWLIVGMLAGPLFTGLSASPALAFIGLVVLVSGQGMGAPVI